MTATTMSAAQLLRTTEPEFDSAVQKMTLKDLFEMITVLQKEMSREQDNFNALSASLGGLKRNSGQYKSVSKEMNASQTRLTMLMNRSMKCFSQQTNQQSVPRKNSQGSAGVKLQRSNSAHEKVDGPQVTKTSVNKPNRNSLADVIDIKIDKQPVERTHLTNGDKASAVKETQSSVVQIKPLRHVGNQSNQVNRTSVEVKPVSTDSETIQKPLQNTFIEAKSKLKSVFNSQNIETLPNKTLNTQLPVSSNVNRSRTIGGTDTKRMSSDLQYDASKTEVSAEKDTGNSKENTNNVKAPVANSSYPVVKELVKATRTDKVNKTSVTLGPMASQKKFISTSTGNLQLHSEKSSDKPKPEVVKGLQSKPKSILVMSHDKQLIDLDSFTDRKSLLAEIKQFDKELKPTKTRDSRETKLTEIGSMSGGAYKVVEKTDGPASKSKLMDDIKLSKKPSEIVALKEQKMTIKKDKEIHNTRNDGNDLYKVKVDQQSVKEQTETVTRIEVKKEETVDMVDSQIQKFDDLLIIEDDQEMSHSNENKQEEKLPSVSIISEPNEVISDPRQVASDDKERNTSASEGSADDSSEAPVDERFISEFQFYQPKVQENIQTKPFKKEKIMFDITCESSSRRFTEAPAPKESVQVSTVTSAPPIKGQGQPAQITQNSRVVAKNEEEDEEEVAQKARMNLTDWDPSALLADLYKIEMMPDTTVDISHRFIGMEGLMEKLPMNKKKATLLKTWKRRFFRAADGWLHYYETSNRDKPSDSLQLMGGKVEELGPRVLGVDDGRGKYLMVRVPTEQEYGQWKIALESQTADNIKATYVTPVLHSPPHPRRKVVIIDIGSSNIRAGILGEKASLPQLFFPTVVAVNKKTGELTLGVDAYKPDVRKFSTITQPIRPTNKVEKFNMDMNIMPEIFKKVFTDLKVNPREYLVMLSTPQKLGDNLKGTLMKILLEQFQIQGICMVPQALLALYSYNSTSGIIVDIGERMEILPIYDGLLIEGGVSHQSYGGAKVQDSLYLALLQNKYQFNTTVEKLLVRHICEEACYIAKDYKEAISKCEKDPESYKTTVFLSNYGLPDGAYMSVDLDVGCFKSPEGFFNTDLWGMDYPNIHKLIYQGIQHSPMDARKHMYRSVYLSGGVTMIPGFAERLEQELRKLAPPTVTVEVHASPQRYHAAYIGACSVASMDVFEQNCVSADEWKKLGLKACRKWGTG